MNANNIKFRCSSLGHIMTEPRSKSEVISETAKIHLVDVFVSAKYGRNTDIQTKYTNKGLMVEEDSLTLYSLYKKQFFKKNDERFENNWISGCPDITNHVRDIKSSWDIFTFFRTKSKKLNPLYFWQLHGYMDLLDDDKAILAYCLIDTPDSIVFDEKRKLQYKMNVIDDANEDFQKACSEIDRLMKYSDIPMNEKIIEIEIKRDQKAIDLMHKRVDYCREWMNTNLFKELVEQAA